MPKVLKPAVMVDRIVRSLKINEDFLSDEHATIIALVDEKLERKEELTDEEVGDLEWVYETHVESLA